MVLCIYIYTYTHVSVDVIVYVYIYMYTETLAYRENLFHKLKKLSKSVLTSSFEACLQPSLSYESHKSGNCSDGEAFDVRLEVIVFLCFTCLEPDAEVIVI